EDVLVHRALDLSDGRPTPLGDDGRTGLAHALEPVHIALALPDPQRCDRYRLRMRMQLTPGAHGRVALEIRPPFANGCTRGSIERLRDRDGWDGIGDHPTVLQHEEGLATLQRARPMRDQQHGAAAHQMPHRAEDLRLRVSVDRARGLVENQHRAVFKEGTCERDALPLAPRELRAALPDLRV